MSSMNVSSRSVVQLVTSKITGMMLELSIQDLYLMVSNPEEFNNIIIEAIIALDQSQQNGAM